MLWIIWSVFTLPMLLYFLAFYIECQGTSVDLELSAGGEINVHIVRAVDGFLEFGLHFRDEVKQGGISPGPVGSAEDYRAKGIERFRIEPSIRMIAKKPDGMAVTFEAMPANGSMDREMTSNLSVAPGVRKWPAVDRPHFPMHAGLNTVHLTVVEVDPSLLGEHVRVDIFPPLKSIKFVQPNDLWLLPAGFLKPVFLCVQAIWLLYLLIKTVRAYNEKHGFS